MSNLKKKTHPLKASHVCLAGILLLLMLAAFLLWFANANSTQSVPATPIQIYFVGQYFAYFAKCVKTGKRPEIAAIESTRDTIRVLELETKSALADGKIIKL